jgi:ubiquinone/menaquinone biosynthesis C-methylase UbiE
MTADHPARGTSHSKKHQVATDFMAIQWGMVDRAADPCRFVRYLDTVSGLETIQRIKQWTYDILNVREGFQLLDLGCGTGDDVQALARQVGTTGRVVGVDASQSMVAEARKRAREANLPLEFRVGDAERLDFADGTFDGCRAERVLMHLTQPERAVAEMVRVVRPGGRVVVYDPDWETLIVDAPDRAITRKLLNFHCDSRGSRWVGRQLRRLLLDAGLINGRVFPETMVFTDYEMANQVFTLEEIAMHAALSGAVSSEQVSQWLSDLLMADKRGSFFAAATGFCVSGEKP